MKLSEKQGIFAHNFGKLLLFVYTLPGYYVTIGDVWSKPEYKAHCKDSKHYDKLGGDLNLFINGEYKIDSEAHRPLGNYWKSLNKDNRWGGDFTVKDGNHYEYNPK